MVDHDHNDEKNDKKSMFKAANFNYCVCNGIEIISTYFLLPAKPFQEAFWQADRFWGFFCYPHPRKCNTQKSIVKISIQI